MIIGLNAVYLQSITFANVAVIRFFKTVNPPTAILVPDCYILNFGCKYKTKMYDNKYLS